MNVCNFLVPKSAISYYSEWGSHTEEVTLLMALISAFIAAGSRFFGGIS